MRGKLTAGQQQSLAKLLRIIEDQTQLIQPLTMLSGRLELLLAQTELQAVDSVDVTMNDVSMGEAQVNHPSKPKTLNQLREGGC